MNIKVDEEVCGEPGDQVEDGHDEAELDPVAPVLELDHIGVIDVDEEDDVVEDGEGVHDGGHHGGLGLLRPGDAQEQAQEEHEVHKHEALELHRGLNISTYIAVNGFGFFFFAFAYISAHGETSEHGQDEVVNKCKHKFLSLQVHHFYFLLFFVLGLVKPCS